MREGAQEEAAKPLFRSWSRVTAFDLRPGGFDQLPIVYTGRTRRHASHAAEAGIEVAYPGVVDGCGAFGGHLHQVNTATRGIHFLFPEDVGGTRRKAKAAMDALVDQLARRGVVSVVSTCVRRMDILLLHH